LLKCADENITPGQKGFQELSTGFFILAGKKVAKPKKKSECDDDITDASAGSSRTSVGVI
jgi:hypothetical protein